MQDDEAIKAHGEAAERSKRRRWVPPNLWTVVVGPLLVLIVGAGVLGLARKLLAGHAGGAPVLVGEPRVQDVPAAGGHPGAGAREATVTVPRVSVLVHNTGQQSTILSEARFIILGYGRMRICGGFAVPPRVIPLSATYDVRLPQDPRIGQTVSAELNQEVGPDQADRFAFRFENNDTLPSDPGLYLLRIEVSHDNRSKPAQLGRALVAVPEAPERSWLTGGPGIDGSCAASNRRTLVRLAASQPAETARVQRLVDLVRRGA